MTDEIRPALSAEEWARLSVDREPHDYTAHEDDGEAFTARAYGQTAWLEADETLVVGDAVWFGDTVWQGRENLTALGALALYGYFTWDDVDELLEQAERSDFADATGDNAGYGMDGGHCRDLAARIAALLPPKR